MPENKTAPTANDLPIPRRGQRAVEYVSDWQLFPDAPEGQAHPSSSANNAAPAGGDEREEATGW